MEWIKEHIWHLILAVLALFLLGGIVINSRPEPTEQTLPELVSSSTSQSSTIKQSQETSSTSSNRIMVDVKGAVKKPGVYELPAESRVTDAIDLAGGFTAEANQKSVNLAKKLTDEAVVYVATQGEPIDDVGQEASAQGQGDLSGQSSGESDKINLNTATSQELQTIPGIGEKRAQDIIDYREEKGGFTSVDELKNISGIGDKTYEKLKDEVEV